MKKNKENKKDWYLIDVENQVLGRVASKIAKILQGKHKPEFKPNEDMGDFVIVINSEKIKVTGRKKEKKIYRRHTGYLGGLKEKTFKEMLKEKPNEIIKNAVWGMLPKNKLRQKRILKLKIYSGPDYSHKEQNPIKI